MNITEFNLVPWDSESYLVAADYAEEQGNLLSNSIRNKVLPFDIENGNGNGHGLSRNVFYKYGYEKSDWIYGVGTRGWGYGYGLGSGAGLMNGIGTGIGAILYGVNEYEGSFDS